MELSQTAGIFSTHRPSGLTEQRVGEQATAHTDPAVDAPDRDLNPGVIEGLLPGEDMLVDAVDERAIQVEYEGLIAPHGRLLGVSGPVTGRWHAA
jgi:hypothetical protein